MRQLLIAAVEATPMPIPLERPIASALGTYEVVDCVHVGITTEDGHVGTGFSTGLGGKASPAVAAYIRDELAPLAVGQDALAPEALWRRLWSPNKARMRGGLGVWALSAVDIACWDIMGQAAGLPLHTLLGGFESDVAVYGSGGWHTLDDDELIAEATGFLDQGITSYKYKIGTRRDRERTQLLRAELGDEITLFADANQTFDVRTAIETSRMLAEYGVAWLEEPVLADSVDDLAEVAAGSAVPVAAGENAYFRWGFREICERRAAAFLQPDVTRCGGITEFRRIGHLADSFGLALSSHLWHELSISLVGAFPSGYQAEYAPLLPSGVLTEEFPVVDGRIRVPDVPGHGVAFTDDAVRRFAI